MVATDNNDNSHRAIHYGMVVEVVCSRDLAHTHGKEATETGKQREYTMEE
jgi:hypothetical protein